MIPVERWLTPERLRGYPRVFFGVFVGVTLWKWGEYTLDVRAGNAPDIDFSVFWLASHMASVGQVRSLYDPTQLNAHLQGISTLIRGTYGWFYPPSFIVLLLPLATLPYLPAYFLFIGLTLGGFAAAIKNFLPSPSWAWGLAAFPGLWFNLLDGQNAFLTASLAGLTLYWMDRRWKISALALGLLFIKPHLVILFPLAFLMVGKWRLLAGAVFFAGGLLGIAVLWEGVATVPVWLHSLDVARSWAENGGSSYWEAMPSVFSSCRWLGMSIPLAYLFHSLVALAAVLATVWVWRNCQNTDLRAAVLTSASLLISPYLFYYDLAWLALPMVFLVRDGLNHGWHSWEREILLGAWLGPLLCIALPVIIPVQIGPLFTVPLLWIAVRRVQWNRTSVPDDILLLESN
ncbi:MAG: DUF2029 domain-containing protein [Ferrovum sp.]|nr:DUF2029 domain-containing protein [Ferrovum sp.]NDU87096.1 DUF2029 domain-containing protein [Ferrovum sp.]